jgi:hypothetical protein
MPVMSEAEDKLDEMERALKAERERLREMGDETEALDRDVNPPSSPIDHANDGGVI